MKKVLLSVFFQSFLVGMLVMPLRGYDFHWSSFAGFFAYYAYMWFALYHYGVKVKPIVLLAITALGLGIFEVPIRIVNYDSTEVSLPDFLLRMGGIILAYFSYSMRRWKSVVLLAFAILLNIFMSTHLFSSMSGWEWWLHYCNTGTFRVVWSSKHLPEGLWKDAIDTCGVSLQEERQGKITLVDFWVERCGLCWRGFPHLQRLYEKYRKNPNVKICSVYTLYPGRAGVQDMIGKVRNHGYEFPVYAISSESSILDTFGIHSFPRVILLDQDGGLVMNYNPKDGFQQLEQYIEKMLVGK